ncbi:glycosyltransferase family 2 protein [Cryobacterium sandaracinum]|uniref:Glycosyltransferase family 2 protein n=1 Tax=Cryobacterium sandaracinum TaxID=1259247 RepID=A0ABY2JHM8_9MICO|nr:glycosyltransferase [Cryobacterium sandaracinum]TFD06090.1 glycosyltransferase family 2 protein [Cryobacterium sandaracinum]
MTLHVIMACHNRRELTLRAVTSIIAAADAAGMAVDFTVFDDGSTDGTEGALRSLKVPILILRGDGSAYWARSMAAAESSVLARDDLGTGPNEWIVWLNDDVTVDISAILQFSYFFKSSVTSAPMKTVVVGAMRDPQTGGITYGGLTKTGWHPLRFTQVSPGVAPIRIDTFNGNLVFVPVPVARALGGIDGDFSHALADIDYGMRCRRLQVPVVLLSATLGTCSRNHPDPEDGLARKWQRFIGAKGGGNFSSLRRIIHKDAPRLWPLYVAATYLLWWIRNVTGTACARRKVHEQA